MDGALALDRPEPWVDTVRSMAPAHSSGHAARARRRRPRHAHGSRRAAILLALGVVFLVVVLLAAFSSGPSTPLRTAQLGATQPAAGPPRPDVVALQGSPPNQLRIQLPVEQANVTAIGYSTGDEGTLPLQPLGRQGNEGLFARVAHRIFGGGNGELVWYQLGGAQGPSTAALDVGAASGTDVYSPVDGTVVGLTPYVLDGKQYGSRIDIEPSDSPSVVVSLTRLQPDPSLTVGVQLSAGTSKVGSLIDLSGVEKQALARYTQDGGNHVTLQIRPTATLPVR
jgi:hypothetical protein